MKKINFMLILIGLIFITFGSCGPVVFSSRLGTPPPPWFYPNRVETVRYVYFPDLFFYYDLSQRNYIYFDNGVWVTVNTLPVRFNGYNLKRSRQFRINDYFGDNIKKYHTETTVKREKTSQKRYY